MSSLSQGLCGNCEHSANCSLNKGNHIWDCSEFQITVLETPASNEYQVVYTPAQQRAVGLCISCTSINTCKWFRNDIAILHCEHYE